MKAIQFDRLGGPEVMALREVPIPEPGPGMVVVRNQAIAVNFADGFFLRGEYIVQPRLPDTPGMEAAGVVAAVGPDVTDFTPGVRVAYIGLGAFSDYTPIRHTRVMRLPDFLGFEEAAAFPIAALTAYHMLHTINRLQPGQTVVVHSAAGGVGLAAVQLAKVAGARVIGTVSSEAKAEAARSFGADEVINYLATDFAVEVMKFTAGAGADLILDGVGRPTFEKGLACLKPFGHLVLFGRASGAPAPLDPMKLFARSISLSGFVLPMIYRQREPMARALRDIFSLVQQGRLRIPIAARFPLSEATAALRALQSRNTVGKVLLIP